MSGVLNCFLLDNTSEHSPAWRIPQWSTLCFRKKLKYSPCCQQTDNFKLCRFSVGSLRMQSRFATVVSRSPRRYKVESTF
jgi:hypothetical protein